MKIGSFERRTLVFFLHKLYLHVNLADLVTHFVFLVAFSFSDKNNLHFGCMVSVF
jgi:hypothetical protein